MSRVFPKQQHGGSKILKTTRILHNTWYKHDTSYTGPQTCAMVATNVMSFVPLLTSLFHMEHNRISSDSELWSKCFWKSVCVYLNGKCEQPKNKTHCYIPRLSLSKPRIVIGWFLVTCPWSNSNVSRPGYNCAVVAWCRIQQHVISAWLNEKWCDPQYMLMSALLTIANKDLNRIMEFGFFSPLPWEKEVV